MMMVRPISKTYGIWNPVPKSIVKKIISYYLSGHSTIETGKKFSVSNSCVGNLLRRNGHDTRGIKYKTGKIENEIIDYYLSGKTALETGLIFGICSTRVYEILNERGISNRHSRRGRGKKTGGKEKEIISFYLKCRSGRKTGLHFKVSDRTVYAILKEGNVKTGNKGVRGKNHPNWKHGKCVGNLYYFNRSKIDPLFKLKAHLRNRISSYLKMRGYKRHSKAYFLLGAPIHIVKSHIEKQFLIGMTWDNHGFGEEKWNLDHIKPLASAKNEQSLLPLFHYTNLQPLWWKDNLRKNSFYEGVRHRIKMEAA
jgi:hypothetical protein